MFHLRSQSDCRAIIGKADKAKRVVLVGASFIAMEVASSLIQKTNHVHVVAPEAVPMETILGPQVGTTCVVCTNATAWCSICSRVLSRLTKARSRSRMARRFRPTCS